MELTEALKKYGTKRGAARALGIPDSTFRSRLKKERKENIVSKNLPYGLTLKEDLEDDYGLTLKGVSALTDSDGKSKISWLKFDVDKEAQVSRIESHIESLIKEIPQVNPKQYIGESRSDLCTNYIISDFHLGQLCDSQEGGEDWSLDEAYEVLCNWVTESIKRSPRSKQAVLVDLGDFLHTDGLKSATPMSGHILDSAARFRTLSDVAITGFDFMIDALLEHHENVHVLICEGNHNIDSSYWMTLAISRKYENEPRVTFDKSHLPFYSYEWGDVSLFYHHGHMKRINDISKVMASEFREMYGRTKYSHCHVGHLHHKASKECNLMEVEQHQTLAPRDAHSSRHGYNSHRGAKIITYHKKFGLQSEVTIRPEMCYNATCHEV